MAHLPPPALAKDGTSPPVPVSETSDLSHLHQAILATFIYADIFNYPLAVDEVARYVAAAAQLELVHQVLEEQVASGRLVRANGYLALAGREDIFLLRQRREVIAHRKWRAARRYGRWLALLPFVRMVAVTGTLAVNNVEASDDIDLLVVTAHGRLWLCRALVIGVVRLARLLGDELCPNYFLSERNLTFEDHNYFNAREVAQMVPLYGGEVYWRIRELNRWVEQYLPRAIGMPNPLNHTSPDGHTLIRMGLLGRLVKRLGEWLLAGRLGEALERWEMQRKIRQLNQEAQVRGGNVVFTPDCCKGHFDQHDNWIMRRFRANLARHGLLSADLVGESETSWNRQSGEIWNNP